MTSEDIRIAMEANEELEYHVTGGEIDPHRLLPASGWYSCFVDDMNANGNVEISLTTPQHPEGLWITVLKRNIPIAFRRAQSEQGEPPEY